jgi:hypothetical protein
LQDLFELQTVSIVAHPDNIRIELALGCRFGTVDDSPTAALENLCIRGTAESGIQQDRQRISAPVNARCEGGIIRMKCTGSNEYRIHAIAFLVHHISGLLASNPLRGTLAVSDSSV